MNSMFYDQLQIQENDFVFFCGDQTSELLSSLLAKEITSQGQKALILSDAPLKYPVEGQILVDIDPELLKEKLNSESSEVFYLCRAIENELLLPVSAQHWQTIIQTRLPNVRLLIQIAKLENLSVLKECDHKRTCLITSLSFQTLEPQLGQFLTDFKSDEKFSDELRKHWIQIVREFCPKDIFSNTLPPVKRFLFINQVKALIDENKMIGILRNLNELYDKIFFGDINDFKIKEV